MRHALAAQDRLAKNGPLQGRKDRLGMPGPLVLWRLLLSGKSLLSSLGKSILGRVWRSEVTKLMKRLLIIAFVLLLVLGGCISPSPDSRITPGISDRWNVGVTGPRSGKPLDRCLSDPSIEESYESLDLPSTHLGIKLVASATKEDAQRIADCLEQRLETGDVSITSPKT